MNIKKELRKDATFNGRLSEKHGCIAENEKTS